MKAHSSSVSDTKKEFDEYSVGQHSERGKIEKDDTIEKQKKKDKKKDGIPNKSNNKLDKIK